jgi:hypothetical protein
MNMPQHFVPDFRKQKLKQASSPEAIALVKKYVED